jgi:hypothetical protein
MSSTQKYMPQDKTNRSTPSPKGSPALLEPSLAALDSLNADALVISLTTDERPLRGLAGYLDWRLCGEVSRFLISAQFTGALGEKVLSITGGRIPAQRLFYFGWGPKKDTEKNADTILPLILETLREAKVHSVAIHLPDPTRVLLPRAQNELGNPLGAKLLGFFESE